MKKHLHYLIAFVLCSLWICCKKEEITPKTYLAAVSTNSVFDIQETSATCGGYITNDGGSAISARGVCWSTHTQATTNDSKYSSGAGAGSFSAQLTGLSPNTTYYVRAYAINGVGTSYGSEISFSTVTTSPCDGIKGIWQITSYLEDGKELIGSDYVGYFMEYKETAGCAGITRWFYYSSFGGSNGESKTQYTVIGNQLNFSATLSETITLSGDQLQLTNVHDVIKAVRVKMPALSEVRVSDIIGGTAVAKAIFMSEGISVATAHGLCWSTNPNPTVADANTVESGGLGVFSVSLSNLAPNTTYYLRAYATNNQGTGYSPKAASFTTPGSAALPVVTTADITDKTPTTATASGTVVQEGSAPVTSRGVCWSSNPSPTIADNHLEAGSGSGNFAVTIPDLKPANTYYVRAFATNSVGTAYGAEQSFSAVYLNLGYSFGGGKVCYLTSDRKHGLVMATSNQSDAAIWGCPGQFINDANHSGIFEGLINTQNIASQCTNPNTGASICLNLSMNGYDDWYLPNYVELNYMIHLAGSNFSSGEYMCSEQGDADSYQAYNADFGVFTYAGKDEQVKVRAVRSF